MAVDPARRNARMDRSPRPCPAHDPRNRRMPSRFVALAIVGFWLATAGWFFSREVWPSLRPDRPPPYAIDLDREAAGGPVKWDVIHKSSRVGEATTLVQAD